jgi:hypothetical protein
MKTVIERRCWLLVGVLMLRVAPVDLRALDTRLTRKPVADVRADRFR